MPTAQCKFSPYHTCSRDQGSGLWEAETQLVQLRWFMNMRSILPALLCQWLSWLLPQIDAKSGSFQYGKDFAEETRRSCSMPMATMQSRSKSSGEGERRERKGLLRFVPISLCSQMSMSEWVKISAVELTGTPVTKKQPNWVALLLPRHHSMSAVM